MPRRPARVTTRTGDGGETSLFGKDRVRKTDPRIEALGDLDEAQAALGLARAALRARDKAMVLGLQRGLYVAMAEVATPRTGLARLRARIDAAAVAELDALVETLRARAAVEGRFVVPGEDAASAALDLARTVARRAERRVVALADRRAVTNRDLIRWLNRLSDVLFLLARAVEARAAPAKRA
ncbi:MAG: cob(I)yrinic acid a,c-diamide adenosyltransferase [Candidatus Limnocylindria bacterium]